MVDTTPTRRSGRRRQVNTRYAGADWDREALRRIRAQSTSSGSSPSNSDINQDPSDDDDFDAVAETVPLDISTDDDSLSMESDTSGSGTSDDSEGSSLLRIPNRQPLSNLHRVPASSKTAVSKGLREVHNRSATLKVMLQLTHGPSDEDLAPLWHTHSKWLRGRDAVLPSRHTLADSQSSFTHLAYKHKHVGRTSVLEQQPSLPTSTRGPQSEETSDVRKERGIETAQLSQLRSLQRVATIDRASALKKRFLHHGAQHVAVTGPTQTQKAYALDALDYCPLKTSSNPDQQEGWLLNVGEKVSALTWAPRASDLQYLAVATRCTPDQRGAAGSAVPRSFGPAFTPSASWPSCIYMWAFKAKAPTESDLLDLDDLDPTDPPRLMRTVGLYAGDILEIKWAPTSSHTAESSIPLMLGVLSTDSHFRIIAIDLDDVASETIYQELEAPVVDIPPPTNPTSDFVITGEDPVFSTFSWLSNHEIILGTSNGLLMSYDILERLSVEPSSITKPSSDLEPYQTLQPHSTYVTAAVPAEPLLPATHRFVATTSAGGDLSLTSLSPSHPASTCTSHRSRLPSRLLTYSPFTRSFLTVYPSSHIRSHHPRSEASAVEPSESTSSAILVAHHLRRFPNVLQLMKLPLEGGSATALAEASVHHPCILVGTAGGEVWATNYVRRVMVFKTKREGMGGWGLKVVRADWREEKATGDGGVSDGGKSGDQSKPEGSASGQETKMFLGQDLFHGQATRKGMTRLVFGWRAAPVDLGTVKFIGKKKKGRRGGKDKAQTASDTKPEQPWNEVPNEANNDEVGGMQVDADGDLEMDDIDCDQHSTATHYGTAIANSHNTDHDPARRKSTAISQASPDTGQGGNATRANDTAHIEDFKAPTETIFEEEQAVTALAWSKDQRTAGWVAVGWGSGLVMVRDLSV